MRKEQTSLCPTVLTPSVQRRAMPRGKALKVQPESLMVHGIEVWGCGIVRVGVYQKGTTSIPSANSIRAYLYVHTHLHTHTQLYTIYMFIYIYMYIPHPLFLKTVFTLGEIKGQCRLSRKTDSFRSSSHPTNCFTGEGVRMGRATMLPLSVRLN